MGVSQADTKPLEGFTIHTLQTAAVSMPIATESIFTLVPVADLLAQKGCSEALDVGLDFRALMPFKDGKMTERHMKMAVQALDQLRAQYCRDAEAALKKIFGDDVMTLDEVNQAIRELIGSANAA